MLSAGAAGVDILPDFTKFRALMQTQMRTELAAAGKAAQTQVGGIGRQLTSLGGTLSRTISLPLLGLGLASLKVASDFESSFAGVRKTVDATEAEFDDLARGMRDLAKEVPVSVNELNRIGELGGQLGVGKEALLDFTDTIAKLSVTTNLTAEDAATAFAQIANVMQLPQDQFDELGSAVVDLGNKSAATESDITEMSQRIAAAGKIAGFSAPDVLGIATALASVGIGAEAGGTAISKAIIAIANAAASGGSQLEGFAEVAGTTGEEFATAFKDRPAEAFASFIEGLRRIRDEGGNVFQVIDDLGLSEVRLRNALLSSAEAGDLFRKSIETGNTAVRDNVALQNEAEKRFQTFESRVELAKNVVVDALIDVGSGVISMVDPVIEGFSTVVELFNDLPAPVKRAAGEFALLAGLAGPTLFVIGKLGGILRTAGGAVLDFSVGMGKGTESMRTFGRVSKTIGFAALAVAIFEVVDSIRSLSGEAQDLLAERQPELFPTADEAERAKKDLGELIGDIKALREEQGRAGGEALLADVDTSSALSQIEAITRELRSLAFEPDQRSLFDKIIGKDTNREARQKAFNDILRFQEATRIASEAATGSFETESDTVERALALRTRLGDAASDLAVGQEILNGAQRESIALYEDEIVAASNAGASTDELAAAIHTLITEADPGPLEALAEGLDGSSDAADRGAESMTLFADAAKLTDDQLKALNDRLKEQAENAKAFIDSVAAFDPLKEASKGKSLSEFEKSTGANLDLMQDFYDDLNAIAGAGAVALAARLLEMGPEGARAANEAAKKIGSKEGLGGLEQLMIDTIMKAKFQGLDPALAAFKPNIEEVAGASIVDPLRQKFAELVSIFESGIPEGVLLDRLELLGGQFRALASEAGVALTKPQQALLDLAESTKDPHLGLIAIREAIDLLGAKPKDLDLDTSRFDADVAAVFEKLRKYGALDPIVGLLADGDPASREIARILGELLGLTSEEFRALVRATDDGTIAEVARLLDNAARDRSTTITATIRGLAYDAEGNPIYGEDFIGPVPKRHGGGDVMAGRPYLVGRTGSEELFVPDVSGQIIPLGEGPEGKRATPAATGAHDHDVVLVVNGREFARATAKHSDRETRELVRSR